MGRTTRIVLAVVLLVLACAPVAYACRVRRAPAVTVTGVPDSCSQERFTARVAVVGTRPAVRVSLDGELLAAESRRSLRVAVSCGDLEEGSHALVVSAKSSAPRTATRRYVFVRD